MSNVLLNSERESRKNVVIVTTTLYNPDNPVDNVRERLAKRMIHEATKIGYEVVVVDGGSPSETLRYFESCGARVYQQKRRGMGTQRREAISYGYDIGVPVIAWMEPEKVPYISQLSKTANPIVKDEAELVIPRRIPVSLDSYPTYQRDIEFFVNKYFRKLTGKDLDVFFGPRTWSRELSHYFLEYQDDRWGDKWDSIFLPLLSIIRDGHRLASADVAYEHPREQTLQEEDDLSLYKKRAEQAFMMVDSLGTYWKELESRLN